jgi:hypothetical protein
MGAASDRGNAIDTPTATGGAPATPQLSIKFQDTPIRVTPREERRVTVQVTPAGARTVRFALLGAQSDSTPVDAALDRSELISDPSGLASVILTAPSSSIDFLLRAQVGDVSATTPISVVAGALVSLEVHPSYAGRRIASEWIASVHVGTTCEDLPNGVVSDSPLLVRGTTASALRLEDVPAADELAVTLRADDFARGCTTVSQPSPNADTEVVVVVTDEPIDLANTTLELSLGIDAKDASFAAELDAALESMQSAMLNGEANDLVALLDDMQAELKAGTASKFTAARAEANWDDSVLPLLGRGADTRLQEAVARYGRIGRAALFSPRAFEGRLTGGGSSETPTLALERVGGIAAEEIGLRAGASSWNVDPSDTLAFAATLGWAPSALLSALSLAPASAETGARDVPGALAEALSCSRLASYLTNGLGDAVAELVAVCPITCLEASCETALVRMWDRAISASGDVATEMSVLATGAATVGPERQAIAVTGSWVGRLSRARRTSQSGGDLEGYEPR